MATININTDNLDKLRTVTNELEEKLSINKFIETSKKELQKILDALPIMISIVDLDHNILKANQQTLDYYNVTKEDLKKKKCFQICHGTDCSPDFCPLDKLLKTGLKETITEIVFEEEGKEWLLITVAPLLDEKGKITSVAHIVQDLTIHISAIYGKTKK